MKVFLEEYGGVIIASVIAIVVIGVIFQFFPVLKGFFNTFVTQMMQ